MGFETTKTETLKKYLEMYFISGEGNPETANRFIREMRTREPEWLDFMQSTANISKNYTPEEMKHLARGGRVIPSLTKKIDFSGEVFKFAHITDTHMGAVFFKEYIWDAVCREIDRRKVDKVFHTGDVTEGLNLSRIDMIYELTHIGYEQQKKYAIEKLGMLNAPIIAVDGNHDRWYKKSAGAMIVKDIADALPNMTYLGEDSADVKVQNTNIRLWHGEDGSSYATSYRLQKLVEAFSGGDKPDILLTGHVHKQGYFFDRNIHCVSGGAVTTQSNWMKRTRKANHTGFWICEAVLNDMGVASFTGTFYPFYE
jgi:predicted phosphodiesterase